MATILLVEDEASMRLLTCAKLKHQFTMVCAKDGVEALELLERQPVDLIIADVMMPRMDGYTLVQTLRDQGNGIPVLLLTAKQSFEDKRRGFSSGVDDYMTKPVNYEEPDLADQCPAPPGPYRQRAADRDRPCGTGLQYLHCLPWGSGAGAAKKEFELLYKLLSYPGQIFTRNQLLDDIWGFDSESGEDTVKTHISRLRNKLRTIEEFRIITIKGLGYKAEVLE